MNCADVWFLLPAYIEGDLDLKQAAEFDAHVKTCPSCMQDLEKQASIDAAVRSAVLSERIDVTEFPRRFRERLSAELEHNARLRSESLRMRWVAAAIGTAAAVFLVLGYHGLFGRRVAGVYAAAAVDHRLEIVEQSPRAWFTDPTQIEALAESQGVPSNAVRSLQSGGYRLDRGKLCQLDGGIYLHLAFSDAQRKFSLYLRQREAGQPAGAEPVRGAGTGNEHVASFETAEVTAIVVTEEPADAALQFAQFASAKI